MFCAICGGHVAAASTICAGLSLADGSSFEFLSSSHSSSLCKIIEAIPFPVFGTYTLALGLYLGQIYCV